MRRSTLPSTPVARKRGGRILSVVAVLTLGAALVGCTAASDVSGLESQLAGIDNVNGAAASVTHPGAPWNTQVVVSLYLDDASDDGVVEAVRAAAPVLAADPVASRNDVVLSFVDGQRSDYATDFDAQKDEISVNPDVYRALGIPDRGGWFLQLSPAQVRDIAGSE